MRRPRTRQEPRRGDWCVYVGDNPLQPYAFFYTARKDVGALIGWLLEQDHAAVKVGAEVS